MPSAKAMTSQIIQYSLMGYSITKRVKARTVPRHKSSQEVCGIEEMLVQ